MCLGGAVRLQDLMPKQTEAEVTTPEARLAAIFLRDLKVMITPAEMRWFLQKNWPAVSSLAHQIHGTENKEQPHAV